MITASQLREEYRRSSEDYVPTERLKSKFKRLRNERQSFYLTFEEFDEILHWKLGRQYGRNRKRLEANTDEVIRAITGVALTITLAEDGDQEGYELELRIGILCALRGVGVPVASAVLALVFPEKYAVIDFRGWRQVFGEEKRNGFSIADYKRYLCEIRRLAEELDWPAQEVDLAIWAYDKDTTAL